MLSRENAWKLVTEHVQSESLRKHLLAVEAAVRGYARQFGEDENAWGFVALVHDFDYEQYPDLKDHPFKGAEILRAIASSPGDVQSVLQVVVNSAHRLIPSDRANLGIREGNLQRVVAHAGQSDFSPLGETLEFGQN